MKQVTPNFFDYLAMESRDQLKLRVVQGEKQTYSYGLNPDLQQHIQMITCEFVGKTQLELYHALLMVMIRRGINLPLNIRRANELWTFESDFLCRNLDSRWLVSACDTIMDFWPEGTERALAAAGALFTCTLKLYETERWATDQRETTPKYKPINHRIQLHDGLSAFGIGSGDMVANLHRRIRALCSNKTPAAKFLLELLARASKFETVFKRFLEVHREESTNWTLNSPQIVPAARQSICWPTTAHVPPCTSLGLEDMVWLFSSDNRNRGIISQNIDEASLLWRAARMTAGPILEIGRRHGGTTVLLLAAGGNRPVVSIDLAPEHHEECDRVFAEVAVSQPGRLQLMIADSRLPLDTSYRFGLLFIDGDHTYDGVRADTIAHWGAVSQQLGNPALVVYHDAVPNSGLIHEGRPNHHEGVQKFCDELISAGCAVARFSTGSSLVLEKTGELPFEWVFEARKNRLLKRHDILTLVRQGGVGIELGVAEAFLSERFLEQKVLSHLYSIDMYAGDRGHDNEQYFRAISRLMPFRESNTLIKLRFDEAVNLFPDQYFDFIYVDGYAHTGEEFGRTFSDFYPKLKPGGIMAGDDYCPEWPLVVDAVDRFLAVEGLALNIIDCREDVAYSKYPTWYTIKPFS